MADVRAVFVDLDDTFLAPDKSIPPANLEMMDRLCAAIPQEGTLLRYHGGMAVLRRAAGSFITLVGDENDRRILGGRMRLNVHLYDA